MMQCLTLARGHRGVGARRPFIGARMPFSVVFCTSVARAAWLHQQYRTSHRRSSSPVFIAVDWTAGQRVRGLNVQLGGASILTFVRSSGSKPAIGVAPFFAAARLSAICANLEINSSREIRGS